MEIARALTSFFCTITFNFNYAMQARTGGFAIHKETAFGVGQGNAITAGVEDPDPSAIYENPVALSEIAWKRNDG